MRYFFTVLILLFTAVVFSQDGKQKMMLRELPVKVRPKTTLNRLTDTFNYCDNDFDGFMLIDLQHIKDVVLTENASQLGTAAGIYICTASAEVLVVTNLGGAPQITQLCSQSSGMGGMLDIAVNQNYEMFVSEQNEVLKIDPVTCQTLATQIIPTSGAVTSLSFDQHGSLYLGGFNSKVYRIVNGDFSQMNTWKDFGYGHAAGDFVMCRDKMYIAWQGNSSFELFEVTVDSNNNYISHVVLGDIPDNTYGLASELGNLYGVNPDTLYKINFNPLSFDTLLTNNASPWYGAAGKNEGVNFDVQIFENLSNAQNNVNPLPEMWTNTISGGQTVYVTIRNTQTNQIIIIPAHIVINLAPTYTNPILISNCVTSATATQFNIRTTEAGIIGPQSNLTVTYHDNENDCINNLNPLPDNVTITGNQKTIFVRVTNNITDCYAYFNFNLEIRPNPIYNDPPDITICHSVSAPDFSVPLADEIPLILNGQDTANTIVTFYNSYNDSVSGNNPLQYPYAVESMHQEIFVRIENTPGGCFETGSFFVDIINDNQNFQFDYNVSITDWTYDDNAIDILAEGNFEYSLDGIYYQDEPFFGNLPVGEYKVYVRDKSNCSVAIKEVFLLMYPKYFTPNEDGYHDFWNIIGASTEPQMKIAVFDRYGKLITSFFGKDIGWDGNYDSRQLPSSDYWFVVSRTNGKKYKGHFTLKR